MLSIGLLVAIAFAAALARGFSGFGAALIFIPLASAILGPRSAVPLLLVADGVMTAGMIPGAVRRADRRAVLTMAAGALVGVPAGVWLLNSLPPLTLRWGIAGLAALMLALLLSGWRYHGRPKQVLTVLVGALSGLFSGAAQIGGPPVVAYWLGGPSPAAVVRANIIFFFAVTTVFSAAGYVWNGLISWQILTLAAIIAPVYGLGAWAGSRMFGLASERTFRRICLCMIFFATIASLPAFDGWLRGG
ncbi:sulfite exporter TauE/SafE family protein [Frigidibacter sp. RF13]|uniref:sulfite exporter TauE/SafE family protein n=1 Tax=Frigidibacter sp. RF13 TaxID=2997340 RepID=UPI00226EAD19|nr:sulfite exporter TauE/SafE family protein [Frigidibacter sp. RF13]MCY1127253.1 sulfite exporter TauE/SafE family protein [Frigidibacter sp. RF13]